jgi:prolyl-tRNA synthetase
MNQTTTQDQTFAQWYQDVITKAQLIDESPTKGCFAFMPYGYSLWEEIKNVLDAKIKQLGAKNVYLPLLIPQSFLHKESKHVDGFAPEVAVVTHAGGKELEEPYFIRPTSETMVYHMFSRWIKSYRDVPLKINQWANIIRWEMRTRPFLRTIEILWQEGHTAHATAQEAKDMALSALTMYKKFIEEYLAIPVIVGEKSKKERFAGADTTYALESLMPDGKSLQMGTSHLLSRNFSSAFGVKYQNQQGGVESPYCTSWGVTTRLIGALVMVHGDEIGLIIPPKIAPIQTIIVPIYKTEEQKTHILEYAAKILRMFTDNNIRASVDDDSQQTPGAKFFHWEMKGVPIRIEIGPRDLENNNAVVVSRLQEEHRKQCISSAEIVSITQQLLKDIQQKLFDQALKKQQSKMFQLESLLDINKDVNGMYQTGWCQSSECEEMLKPHKLSIRCTLSEITHSFCFSCKKKSTTDVLVAKAY